MKLVRDLILHGGRWERELGRIGRHWGVGGFGSLVGGLRGCSNRNWGYKLTECGLIGVDDLLSRHFERFD